MSYLDRQADFSDLIGKTVDKVDGGNEGDEEIKFYCSDGVNYLMYHAQDCCENVRITDIDGDIQEILVGQEVLVAEEITNADFPEPANADSYTWTFYKLATIKGWLTIRWLGESNGYGYYSESVEFEKI